VLRGKEDTWVQCQCCGYLYQIDETISINKSIVNYVCPKCGYKHALNCGNYEDIYYYYNVNLDERYY
jgi:transcription elongation factor Elf1